MAVEQPPAAPVEQPQPPAFDGQQPAPAAKPKGGKGKKFLRVVALIVVAIAVKFGISYMFNSPVHAEAGDCVRVTGSENNPEVDTKDCSDKDANYKVVKVVDDTFDTNSCGTVGQAALAQQWDAEKFVLCLDPVK
ncbi:LppU/SCO3897 family protein [Streptomyces lichenis]|uniref:Uncharacterized protein n=1 Tax=Streptomyces lichenis TaxID=2306967 RepID=A0ABT0IFI6_9ACTN|nr:hypothetical protein [Streptomyces lichenis]MCK8680097.1 hypothetical protein [Streptomyces lichenis]